MVVGILLSLNLIVYLAWLLARFDYINPTLMIDNFLVSWQGLEDGRVWTLLTSVFSHSNLLHFFFNFFTLKSFGPIVENILGPRRFLIFFLLAGIVASFSHAAVSAFIVGDPTIPALGASGAISGVILLFSAIFPRERILIFGIIPIPAAIGALAFVGLDIWGLVAQAEGGGLPIGHGAHLGGAACGIVYFIAIRKRLRRQVDAEAVDVTVPNER